MEMEQRMYGWFPIPAPSVQEMALEISDDISRDPATHMSTS